MTAGRRLPVPWWQRPQHWSDFSEDDRGELASMAHRMWRIRELMRPVPDHLRKIQPKEET